MSIFVSSRKIQALNAKDLVPRTRSLFLDMWNLMQTTIGWWSAVCTHGHYTLADTMLSTNEPTTFYRPMQLACIGYQLVAGSHSRFTKGGPLLNIRSWDPWLDSQCFPKVTTVCSAKWILLPLSNLGCDLLCSFVCVLRYFSLVFIHECLYIMTHQILWKW